MGERGGVCVGGGVWGGESGKRRRRRKRKKISGKTNNKLEDLNPNISIIALNVTIFNIQKKKKQVVRMNNKTNNYILPTRNSLPM